MESQRTRPTDDPPRAGDDAAFDQSFDDALSDLAGRPLGDGRVARASARAVAWTRRVTAHGPLGTVAEIAWATGRRDVSVAGSVLAAAVAYRIFIWLIPVGFFLVVVFGVYTDAASVDATETLDSVGVAGYIAASVGQASGGLTGLTRVLALLVSTWLVLYETLILLRTLRSVTALAWKRRIPPLGNPVIPTMGFLGLTVGSVAVGQASTPLRAQLGDELGLAIGLAALLLMPAYWLAVSLWFLPHAARRWTQLVPGALFFGAGMALLHVFYVLVLFPWVGRKQETYGVLGVAAGLLFGFFLVGRMVELAASLNAVLAERARRSARSP